MAGDGDGGGREGGDDQEGADLQRGRRGAARREGGFISARELGCRAGVESRMMIACAWIG